jgi:3'-phosphoadenosine 5'-phosphosulfate sulfotransferase (PAPS reductase)/FAD synthetase
MIVHFSCGAASAVSALLALKHYDNVELVYTDPGLEHKDNHRFLRDFEKLTNTKVTILKHEKYKTPFEVFEARRFLASPAGAPCTTELKKITAREYLGDRLLEEVNVFGFDCSKKERGRAERYCNNNLELKTWFPLIEYNICKSDCYYILDQLGLDLPFMYKLGYKNANCTGCVKADSLGYWAAIREDFPKVFNKYAKIERIVGAINPDTGKPKGATINRKRVRHDECNGKGCKYCKLGYIRIYIFLDEIPEDQKPQRNISFTCGYSCGAQDMELATEELTKEPTLIGYMIAQELKEQMK